MKNKKTKRQIPKSYKKITHSDRIHIIYLKKVHDLSLNEIAAELRIKYNSIRNIILAYDHCGRTNKKRYQKRGGQNRERHDQDDDEDEDQNCGIIRPQSDQASSSARQPVSFGPTPDGLTRGSRIFNTQRLQAFVKTHRTPEGHSNNLNSEFQQARQPTTTERLAEGESAFRAEGERSVMPKGCLVDVQRQSQPNKVYGLRLYVSQGLPPVDQADTECRAEIEQNLKSGKMAAAAFSQAPTRHCSPEGLNSANASFFPAPLAKQFNDLNQYYSAPEKGEAPVIANADLEGEAKIQRRDSLEEDYDSLNLFDNRHKLYPYWKLNQHQMWEDETGEIGHSVDENHAAGEEPRRQTKVFSGSLGFLNNVTLKSKVNTVLQTYEKADRTQALRAMKSLPISFDMFLKK